MTDNKQVRAMMWASALQGAMAADKDCVFKPDDLAKYAGGRAEALYKKWQSVTSGGIKDEDKNCGSCKYCDGGGCYGCHDEVNYSNWEPKQ